MKLRAIHSVKLVMNRVDGIITECTERAGQTNTKLRRIANLVVIIRQFLSAYYSHSFHANIIEILALIEQILRPAFRSAAVLPPFLFKFMPNGESLDFDAKTGEEISSIELEVCAMKLTELLPTPTILEKDSSRMVTAMIGKAYEANRLTLPHGDLKDHQIVSRRAKASSRRKRKRRTGGN